MLKKLLGSIVVILLSSISVFFVSIIAYLASSEISPALQKGSLNVETSTMILNYVWEGNEIYVLLMLYALLACVSGYAAIRVMRKVIAK